MEINLLATFALLVGLEVVLGIDNILLISILTDRLAPEQRDRARYIGLGLAFVARCILLLGASYILRLSEPVLMSMSWKDLILIGGGGFLLFKAVKEIHHVVEGIHGEGDGPKLHSALSSVIMQMVMLDLVFSIDSVVTAVGLTDNLYVIYSSVVVSFIAVLLFAGKISAFVHKHPSLKVLALSFLVTIGVTLCVEGFGGHVPKSYIYLPMGFALAVNALQMRLDHNAKRAKKAKPSI